MTSPLEALQSAIFLVLNGDAPLEGLLGTDAVFESVPDGASPPFLTIAQHDIFARDTGDLQGYRHTLTLNAWSQSGGRQQVAAILDAARLALELSAPNPTGYTLVLIRFDRLETRQDIRARLWKGALRLTAITEPTL